VSYDTSKFDVNDPQSMRQRSTAFAYENTGLFTNASDYESLLQVQSDLLAMQDDLNVRYKDATRSVYEREMALKGIAGISAELSNVESQLLALREAGSASEENSHRTIMQRFEGLNEELRVENEILRVHEQINHELDLAVRAKTLTRDQATALKNDLIDVTNLEQQRRDNEKEIARLQKREGTLEGYAREALQPATVIGAMTQGSDQARAFLENERLRSMAQKDAEPQIKELRDIRAEIKRLRESNEKIGQSRPAVAQLF
jgi:hypothetical protein